MQWQAVLVLDSVFPPPAKLHRCFGYLQAQQAALNPQHVCQQGSQSVRLASPPSLSRCVSGSNSLLLQKGNLVEAVSEQFCSRSHLHISSVALPKRGKFSYVFDCPLQTALSAPLLPRQRSSRPGAGATCSQGLLSGLQACRMLQLCGTSASCGGWCLRGQVTAICLHCLCLCKTGLVYVAHAALLTWVWNHNRSQI